MTAISSAPPSWRPLTGTAHQAAIEVLLHGPLSRSELADRLDLTAGTLTRATRPLIDSGLLRSTGVHHGALVGRPSEPLDIAEDSHHFIGVKLTADRAYATLTTLRARVLASESASLDDHDPARVVDVVARLVSGLGSGHAITALGVSLGGSTAGEAGTVYARFLDWDAVPLAELLETATGLRTVVENDVSALTRATHWFGAGRTLESFALVTIGAGVGYGLVARGHQVTTPDVGLGQVSHFPLDPAGPLCPAGHRGCATAMLTTGAIAGAVSVALGRTVGFDEVLALAREGHPAAAAQVSAACHALGTFIGMIATLTVPQRVILSGEGVDLVAIDRAAVDAGIAAVMEERRPNVEIDVVPAPFEEWARGAAVVAIQTYVLGSGD